MGGAELQPMAAEKLLLVQPIRILASTEMDGKSSAAAYGSGEIVIGSADPDTSLYGDGKIIVGKVDPVVSLNGDAKINIGTDNPDSTGNQLLLDN